MQNRKFWRVRMRDWYLEPVKCIGNVISLTFVWTRHRYRWRRRRFYDPISRTNQLLFHSSVENRKQITQSAILLAEISNNQTETAAQRNAKKKKSRKILTSCWNKVGTAKNRKMIFKKWSPKMYEENHWGSWNLHGTWDTVKASFSPITTTKGKESDVRCRPTSQKKY